MPVVPLSNTAPLLADQVKSEVLKIYEREAPAYLPFNNVQRIERSLQVLRQISEGEALSERQTDLIALALLFHFGGRLRAPAHPAPAAKEWARSFLRERDYPALHLTQIEKLIDAAGRNRPPENRWEKILLDALNSYMGQKRFRSRSELLRKELEMNEQKTYTEPEWRQQCLRQLQQHVFYTPTAQQLFEDRKQKNLKKTRRRIKKYEKALRKKEKQRTIQGNRAARMIFKTALRNHIDLTNIADRKANMMLSINALILTIGLPLFSAYLFDQPYLYLPAGTFLLTAILSIFFATLATRPIKMTGETDLEEIPSGKTNLFFFGNFYKLSADEYVQGIQTVLANEEIVEQSIVNDLYYLGHSLGAKFNYLRICYNVFAIGISLSAIAFIVSFLLWSQ